MHFDEAVNIYGNGICTVLISPTAAHIPVAMQLKFSYTNNTAKYEACITSLKLALDMIIGTWKYLKFHFNHNSIHRSMGSPKFRAS